MGCGFISERLQPAGHPGERLFQALQRPDVSFRGGVGLELERHGGLAGRELFEVPQRQHLAVDRVERVERVWIRTSRSVRTAACVGDENRPNSIDASANELAGGEAPR